MKKRLLSILLSSSATVAAIAPLTNVAADDATIQSLQNQINHQQAVVNELDGVHQQALGAMAVTEGQISETIARAQELVAKQQATQQEIDQLTKEIKALEQKIEQRKSHLDKQARALQVRASKTEYIDFLLKSDSFTDLVSRFEVVNKMIRANKAMIEKQTADKEVVDGKVQEQVAKQEEQNRIAYELEVLKANLDSQYASQAVAASQAAGARDAAAADLGALQNAKAEAEFQAEQARLAAEAAAAQAQAEAAAAQAQAEAAVQAQTEAATAQSQAAPTQVEVAQEQASVVEGEAAVAEATAPAPAAEVAVASAVEEAAPVSQQPTVPAPATPAPAAVGSSVLSTASQYLGTPYVWGGSTPAGFDCSGFVQYVFAQHGKQLPRVTYNQENAGTRISVSEAQPGDLLFWGNPGSSYHVGIYQGNGRYIHAPQPGESVKESTISGYTPSFAVRL